MRNVFLFPGQGSQFIKMGKDFYDEYNESKEIFNIANKITNMNVKELCFEATDEELKKTENAQICIATTSLAILEVIKNSGIEAEYAAGLSLGEYVALVYGGFISIEDCFRLLKVRGYLMQNLVPDEKYKMAAVIGLDSGKIEEICKKVESEGTFVVPANYNYSMQTVISGTEEGINKAGEKLKEAGAKRVIELNTSGPFHTKKLEKAKDEYKKELDKINFGSGNNVKIIRNLDGKIYEKEDNFTDILSNHIVNPVRFDKAINIFKESKIDNYIEIGPGKAMTGFIKKEIKDANTYNVESIDNLKILLGGIK